MSEESKKPEGGSGGGWKASLESAKEVTTEIYRDGLKPAVQQFGHTLGTTIGVALAPLNFVLSYAKDATDYLFERADKKLAGVPPEARLLVDPSISAPIILNHALLGDRKDVEALRDMYASQLASAIDPATASGAHPSYAQIIASLSPSEGALVKALASDGTDLWPMVTGRIRLMGIPEVSGPYYWTPEAKTNPLHAVQRMINLRRLGLIEEVPDTMMLDDEWKARCIDLEQYLRGFPELRATGDEYMRGFYKFTVFGEAFVRVCIRD